VAILLDPEHRRDLDRDMPQGLGELALSLRERRYGRFTTFQLNRGKPYIRKETAQAP